MMTEYIYVKFWWENFGYQAGDVVKAKLNKRDHKGVHVTMTAEAFNDGKPFNAWSDLGSFSELNGMEVIAHFASEAPVF